MSNKDNALKYLDEIKNYVESHTIEQCDEYFNNPKNLRSSFDPQRFNPITMIPEEESLIYWIDGNCFPDVEKEDLLDHIRILREFICKFEEPQPSILPTDDKDKILYYLNKKYGLEQFISSRHCFLNILNINFRHPKLNMMFEDHGKWNAMIVNFAKNDKAVDEYIAFVMGIAHAINFFFTGSQDKVVLSYKALLKRLGYDDVIEKGEMNILDDFISAFVTCALYKTPWFESTGIAEKKIEKIKQFDGYFIGLLSS